MNKALSTVAVAALLALSLFACSKKEAAPVIQQAGVTVKAVTLGNAIGADKRVTAPLDSFAKNDTIYIAVETTGSGNAMLKAKWTYHKGDTSAVVDKNEQTLVATGPAVTEFHISKPDGWPTGDYQVEVLLNEASTGVHKFTVK
jgi:hypothetical protein